MGIRFNTNTWRAPLQLIDCWLPHHPSAELVPTKPAPRVLQRFVKAGWLHKPSPQTSPTAPANSKATTSTPRRCSNDRMAEHQRWTAPLRMPESRRSDGRLVLSGRIDQVCAELDRLAAIEQRMCQ